MSILNAKLLNIFLIIFKVILLQEVFGSDRVCHSLDCVIDVILQLFRR